jgi:hypothetical protein
MEEEQLGVVVKGGRPARRVDYCVEARRLLRRFSPADPDIAANEGRQIVLSANDLCDTMS